MASGPSERISKGQARKSVLSASVGAARSVLMKAALRASPPMSLPPQDGQGAMLPEVLPVKKRTAAGCAAVAEATAKGSARIAAKTAARAREKHLVTIKAS